MVMIGEFTGEARECKALAPAKPLPYSFPLFPGPRHPRKDDASEPGVTR